MNRRFQNRFSDIFWTEAGNKVRVEFQDAPELNPGAVVQPRKVAVIQKGPLVPAGTVIFGMGTGYLLILQDQITNLNRFRAIEITHRFPWVRKDVIIDPVARVEREATPRTIKVALPVVLEPLHLVQEKGIERAKFQILTGDEVRIGDLIGPYQVNAIVETLGIKRIEVF